MRLRLRILACVVALAVLAVGVSAPDAADTKTYLVLLKGDPVVAYEGDINGLPATKPGKGKKINPNSKHVRKYVQYLESHHDEALAEVGAVDAKIYSYKYAVNGFAARLTADQVAELKSRPDVMQVVEDELMQPTTDNSPTFIGLTEGGEAWSKGYTGEDVVIGIIDTGIWPEHPSFADVATPMKGNKGPEIPYGPIPEGFTPSGCDFGNTAANPLDAPFECNNKLIAARCYNLGFSSAFDPSNPCGGDGVGTLPEEYQSARDQDGHGSHTASTAGGNNGVPAEIEGTPLGSVSGMAPRARIAAYKVCWNGSFPPAPYDGGCFSSDSAAAIDQAVADGVDVINFSIGGSGTNFNGADDIAFLFAADAGVFVATSQGNDGPGPQTTGTPSGVPWITAVGAMEDNQVFGTGLVVSDPASIAATYAGLEGISDVSLADTGDIMAPVVPSEPANGCTPYTNAADVDGNIALVIRGACSFSTKYNSAAAAGAQAIVVYNDGTAADRINPIYMSAPGTTIPGIMISYPDGALVAATAASDPVTGMVGPSIVIPRVDRIANFSSRGPNGGAPDVIKPDITAPGVDILAAQTPTPNDGQLPGQLFQIIGGTSMASPHVAGVFALLKEAHPDWTPAIARSALMTTARQNLRKSFVDVPADPFDMGAGQIVPNDAFDPGLAYDAGLFDYAAFTCGNNVPIFTQGSCDFLASLGYSFDGSELNLPSIGIGALAGVQTVSRTVTNVASNQGNKSFYVSVDPPPGIDVEVWPTMVKLKPGESATYYVTLTTNGAPLFEWAFGSLTWSHGGEYAVRSPIAVRPILFVAPDEVAGSGTEGSLSFDVSFGYSGDYAAGVHGLNPADMQDDTVEDDPSNNIDAALATCDFSTFPYDCVGITWHEFTVPAGAAFARFALFDDYTDGADDLDLYVWRRSDGAYQGGSGSGTSAEEVNLLFPAADVYEIAVHGWGTDGPDANYTLFNWTFGLVDDAGNMTVTAPTAATVGTATVDVDWAGLAAGNKYLGAVSHSDGVGLLGLTLVSVATD
jgi:subtilisin family serine protease